MCQILSLSPTRPELLASPGRAPPGRRVRDGWHPATVQSASSAGHCSAMAGSPNRQCASGVTSSAISKHCCRPKSTSANNVRSNGASAKPVSVKCAMCHWPRSAPIPVPSHGRTRPEGRRDCHHQPAILRIDFGDSPIRALCKALIDRTTDRANIIETGTESYRFRRTFEKRKANGVEAKS